MFSAKFPVHVALVLNHVLTRPRQVPNQASVMLKFTEADVPMMLVKCHEQGGKLWGNGETEDWQKAYIKIAKTAGVNPNMRIAVDEDDIRAFIDKAVAEDRGNDAVLARAALNGNVFKRQWVQAEIVRSRINVRARINAFKGVAPAPEKAEEKPAEKTAEEKLREVMDMLGDELIAATDPAIRQALTEVVCKSRRICYDYTPEAQ